MIYFLSFLLLSAGIVLLLGLTPESVTADIMAIIEPKPTFYSRSLTARGKGKKHRLAGFLVHLREALVKSGKGGIFATVCSASLGLIILGFVFGFATGNGILSPLISIVLGIIPIVYAKMSVSAYDKQLKEEMETAVSVITTSYIRSDDIITAVSENLPSLKPPVKAIFQGFVNETTFISADIKSALQNLRIKIDNSIFREWCTALIQCQTDRTYKDSLQSIASKFTDVRIVNNELKTQLAETKKEYWTMVALVFANIPILYFINREWFNTLMFSLPGKLTLAVCGTCVLVTAALMMKFTRPVEYRR